MAALDVEREPLGFVRLKAIADTTDGNLGAHLATLERAGYIRIDKEPIGKRTRINVAITGMAARRSGATSNSCRRS